MSERTPSQHPQQPPTSRNAGICLQCARHFSAGAIARGKLEHDVLRMSPALKPACSLQHHLNSFTCTITGAQHEMIVRFRSSLFWQATKQPQPWKFPHGRHAAYHLPELPRDFCEVGAGSRHRLHSGLPAAKPHPDASMGQGLGIWNGSVKADSVSEK